LRASLKKYEDFKLVLSSGERKVLNKCIICYLNKDVFLQKISLKSKIRHAIYSASKTLVFGILTSKKMGCAVKRNHFKRLVRASLNKASLNPNYFYVFLPNLKPRTQGSLPQDLAYLAKKLPSVNL